MENTRVENTASDRTVLIIGLFSALYFLLAFSGAFHAVENIVVHALFELFTIPLIIIQALILFRVFRNLLTGRRSLNLIQAIPGFIALAIIVCMFFVD